MSKLNIMKTLRCVATWNTEETFKKKKKKQDMKTVIVSDNNYQPKA